MPPQENEVVCQANCRNSDTGLFAETSQRNRNDEHGVEKEHFQSAHYREKVAGRGFCMSLRTGMHGECLPADEICYRVVFEVRVESQKSKEKAQQLRSSDNTSHRFNMHRVYSEKCSANGRCEDGSLQVSSAQIHVEKDRVERMENNVHEMEAIGVVEVVNFLICVLHFQVALGVRALLDFGCSDLSLTLGLDAFVVVVRYPVVKAIRQRRYWAKGQVRVLAFEGIAPEVGVPCSLPRMWALDRVFRRGIVKVSHALCLWAAALRVFRVRVDVRCDRNGTAIADWVVFNCEMVVKHETSFQRTFVGYKVEKGEEDDGDTFFE